MAPGSFGPTLQAMRQDLGLSQSALALRLGSTQRHLSFLETGRSAPSREFVARIVSELSLSAAQRATLLEASGYRGPALPRDTDSSEVQAALDLMERQILAPWPYPAFVHDRDWTILRSNAAGGALVERLLGSGPGNAPRNIFEMLLSDGMRGMISNWTEASAAFYFRLLEASARSGTAGRILKDARASGLFDHVADHVVGAASGPVFVPVEMTLPGIGTVRLTSMLGRMATAHDALGEGLEIEMLVPLDDVSGAAMRGVFAEV